MMRVRFAWLTVTLGMAWATSATTAGSTSSNGIYDKTCSVCHQAAGAGVPGAFPRLAGRVGRLASVPAGRRLAISAVLYGMAGKLQVDEQTIVGVMTPFPQLTDGEIANVLNYVAGLDHKAAKPFTAAEVAAIRAQPALSPSEVNVLARDPELTRVAP